MKFTLLIFLAGLALSLVLSYFFGGVFMFLFLPFLFFGFKTGKSKVCPQCGRETMHPAEVYCAVDGTRLERK